MTDLAGLIENITGKRPCNTERLTGGCIADVFKVYFADDPPLVVKTGNKGCGLDIEARMIRYLSNHSDLPVPDMMYSRDDVLLMSWIPGSGPLSRAGEQHAADLLARLHGIKADQFGFDGDTLIGGLKQTNDRCESWPDFFRDQRLLYMAHKALDNGRIENRTMALIERLAQRLPEWIDNWARPSLIHGDIWSGNVIGAGDRIAGFIDPAIYYADPEMELAFILLFRTFSEAFFDRYRDQVGIRPGFFEERADIYNLYPLLVHVVLFGGHYVRQVEGILGKYGC